MKIQDPRKLITVELPSYPGSSVTIYNDLTTGQKMDLQEKYNHVMQAMMKSTAGKPTENIESTMLESMSAGDGLKISELNEMNLYMIFLAIKEWNLEDDNGNIEISMKNLKELLYDKDVTVLRNIVSPSDEKKN